METLFTPWRYPYIKRNVREADCFFCTAARQPDDPERLVVHLSTHHLVILNRYPYTSGHLMVAPRAHLASPPVAPPEAQAELWPVALACQRVLEEAYRPDGFNLGMNLGSCAGAGVSDHFHLHVVPRWHGDSNFMGVIGEVRLVPEPLYDSWRRLRELFSRLEH